MRSLLGMLFFLTGKPIMKNIVLQFWRN